MSHGLHSSADGGVIGQSGMLAVTAPPRWQPSLFGVIPAGSVRRRPSDVVQLIVGLLFKGSLEQTRINWDVTAPTTGWSMAIVSSAGLVFAVLAGLLLLVDLYKIVTGQLSDDELVMVQESEEAVQLKQVLADAGNGKGAA